MFSADGDLRKGEKPPGRANDLRGRTLSGVTQPKPHPARDHDESARPRVEPLDPPMVPFAVAGLAAFAIAGLIVRLANGPDGWLDTCVAGFLVGIPGLITMIIHDRNRRRRRSITHAAFRES